MYRNHSYSYHFDTMIDFLPYICCKCWKRCCIYECQGSIFQSPTYHLIVIENVNAQCFSQASLFLSWCFSRNFFELGSFSGISIPLSSIFLSFFFHLHFSLSVGVSVLWVLVWTTLSFQNHFLVVLTLKLE